MDKILWGRMGVVWRTVVVGVVAMGVLGGGRAFATISNDKLPVNPQKWKLFLEWYVSRTPEWRDIDRIEIVKNVGAWTPSIELKNGQKEIVKSSPTGGINNVKSITTGGNQYIEFVTWSGNVPWNTIKAKKGTYWRVDPNTRLVFMGNWEPGTKPTDKIYGFYLESGSVSIDQNYVTLGETIDFVEAIAASINYTKVKGEVAGWKSALDKNPKFTCPANMVGQDCGCKRDLVQHTINAYAEDARATGAVLGALPLALALPAEFFGVMPQYRANAALAYAVACAYGGQVPTQSQFEMHLMELMCGTSFSSARREQINGMAGAVKGEFIQKAGAQIAKKIAPKLVSSVPLIGTAVGVTMGVVANNAETKKFGNNAKAFYKPKRDKVRDIAI